MTGSGELLLPSVGWRRIGIISHMAYWILVRYDKTHFGVKMYSVICLNREKEQLQFHRVTAHWRLTSQPCEVSGPRLSLQRHSVSHWDCRPAGFSGFKENGMAQSRRPWTCKCSSFGSPQNSWYFSKPLPPSVKWQAYEFFFQRPTEENTLLTSVYGNAAACLAMKPQGPCVRLVPRTCLPPLLFQSPEVGPACFLFLSANIHSSTWVLAPFTSVCISQNPRGAGHRPLKFSPTLWVPN